MKAQVTEFTVSRASRLAGVSLREMAYWLDQQLVLPQKNGNGRGKARVLTFQSLMEAAILKELVRAEFKPSRLREMMDALRGDQAFAAMYTPEAFARGEDGLKGLMMSISSIRHDVEPFGRAPREGDRALLTGSARHQGALAWLDAFIEQGYVKEDGEIKLKPLGKKSHWSLSAWIAHGVPAKDFCVSDSPQGKSYRLLTVVHVLDLGRLEEAIYSAA